MRLPHDTDTRSDRLRGPLTQTLFSAFLGIDWPSPRPEGKSLRQFQPLTRRPRAISSAITSHPIGSSCPPVPRRLQTPVPATVHRQHPRERLTDHGTRNEARTFSLLQRDLIASFPPHRNGYLHAARMAFWHLCPNSYKISHTHNHLSFIAQTPATAVSSSRRGADWGLAARDAPNPLNFFSTYPSPP